MSMLTRLYMQHLHTYTHTCHTFTHIHTYTPTRIHTNTHTRTAIHTHTHTHTRRCIHEAHRARQTLPQGHSWPVEASPLRMPPLREFVHGPKPALKTCQATTARFPRSRQEESNRLRRPGPPGPARIACDEWLCIYTLLERRANPATASGSETKLLMVEASCNLDCYLSTGRCARSLHRQHQTTRQPQPTIFRVCPAHELGCLWSQVRKAGAHTQSARVSGEEGCRAHAVVWQAGKRETARGLAAHV